MTRRTRIFRATCGLLVCSLWVGAIVYAGDQPARTQKPTIDFNRDVRPILAKRCWPCHGTDQAQLQKTGNMRLDTFAGATEDRGGYKAIEPKHPEKSALMERISEKNDARRMPPKESGIDPLKPDEQEIIRQWIAEGAEYRQHWAYVAPTMPVVPNVSDPKWVRGTIDRFIMARMDESKLKPEPEADKATLIRRVSLTLTGLPPTPAEIDAFVKDNRKDAYERLVDRLLKSPRYGENQARYWLDAVRYADTHGLHIDNERAVYPYRDWVVRAFNEDLPYNDFALWQLAGDLLPNPTLDQMIATGYVRMNPTTAEGGAIEAEVLAKNTFDRVDTTSTVFLASTLGCARCHDHKYDPFTQKDYYSMYAFFDSTTDTPLDGNAKLHGPVMKAPTPKQSAELSQLKQQLAKIESATRLAPIRAWVAKNPVQLPTLGAWEATGPFVAKDFETAFTTDFGPEGKGSPMPWRLVDIKLEQPFASLVGKDNAAAYVRNTLTVDRDTDVLLRLGSDDGIRVWLNGALILDKKEFRSLSTDTDKLTIKLKAGKNEFLAKIVNGGGGDGIAVGLGDETAKRMARATTLTALPKMTPAEESELKTLYLTYGPDSADAKRFRASSDTYMKLDAAVPYTYIAQELPMARETRLLKRGNYDQPGDIVTRALPTSFGKLGADQPANRLGLAKWMVDPKNPLVARVFVNRLWQQHFGSGLVRTSEDFGSRGEWPTHPELLDYLAVKFVQDGWSVKRLTKEMLCSATYRQSAAVSAQKRAADPENKLYARGPRFRLDAEVIRDTALYVSGLLVENGGGHGDKPYQPAGLWEAIAYPISDTAKYVQDHGPALYRRSLYLFWKRTSPPPYMMLFDAPMREACVVRRSRTNTPTQALVTLNETGFFEAARALAQRTLLTKGDDTSRLSSAFRLATGRAPQAAELTTLADYLKYERDTFSREPGSAERALAVGESPRDKSLEPKEHAAWMMVCNLILNLDESLTQH